MKHALAITIAMVLALVLVVAWAGRVSEGRRALADSDAALARTDPIDAILAARVAASARCPAGCSEAEGYAKLEHIARDAEARGDDPTAFAAWRATRASLLSTSAAGTRSAERAHAEVELARLAHRLDAAAVAAGASPTGAADEAKLREAFRESDLPGGLAFALVGAGGLAFVVFAFRFALTRKAGRADAWVALAGLAATLAGILLF
ncbi:MAG: hypothetical protein JWP97_404 [Labilithrix sp.]|nr:hypothetical protein [Labilithrix sp.]